MSSARPNAKRVQFLLSAALGICLLIPSLAHAQAYEPNDTRQGAFGPIAGGSVYAGAIETENDSDWFSFVVGSRAQLSIPVTNTSSAEGACGQFIDTFLVDGSGDTIASDVVEIQETESYNYTARPGRYFMVFEDSGCNPSGTPPTSYNFRVEPPSALLPAEEIAARCERARTALTEASKQLRQSRRRFKSAPRGSAKRSRARRAKKEARRSVKQATRRVGNYCG
jgi:hypothetical protein